MRPYTSLCVKPDPRGGGARALAVLLRIGLKMIVRVDSDSALQFMRKVLCALYVGVCSTDNPPFYLVMRSRMCTIRYGSHKRWLSRLRLRLRWDSTVSIRTREFFRRVCWCRWGCISLCHRLLSSLNVDESD